MAIDLSSAAIHSFPHGFINKRGEPILAAALSPPRHRQLIDMYLGYRPREAFAGLPPLGDQDCIRWVEGMIASDANLVALSFQDGIVGHGAISPAGEKTCRMLTVVTPPYQMTGIGSELTRRLIELSHELGFQRIQVSVDAMNHAARHVYEKCGFACLTTGPAREVDMTLDLASHYAAFDGQAGEIMNRRMVVLHPEMPCKVALMIFLQDGVDTLPVVKDNNLLTGILSETDLMVEGNIDRKVADVHTRDVVAVRENSTITKVVSLFRSRNLRCIPVLNRRNELVGVVRRKDLLAHYLKRYGQRLRPGHSGRGL